MRGRVVLKARERDARGCGLGVTQFKEAVSKAAIAKGLVVNCRPEERRVVAEALEGAGLRVLESNDSVSGWALFRDERPSLVVAAASGRGVDGIEFVAKVRSGSAARVLVTTSSPDVRVAVEAMRKGADDVMVIPAEVERLIENAREVAGLEVFAEKVDREIVGTGTAMQAVRDRVVALASLDVPVLIRGERGTGRDHVARVLHRQRFGR
jgi:two-component system C4-dicarboxylate transport response regulator DctD